MKYNDIEISLLTFFFIADVSSCVVANVWLYMWESLGPKSGMFLMESIAFSPIYRVRGNFHLLSKFHFRFCFSGLPNCPALL